MQLDAADIERIVRIVVERLTAAQPNESGPNDARPAAWFNPEPSATVDSGLVLDAKVVSLVQLDGKLNGARQVTVRQGAIVTPAARDWLKDREILIRVAEAPANVAPSVRLAVGEADSNFDPTELLRSLAGGAIERLAKTGLTNVVEELGDQVAKGGGLGLLVTRSTVAGLCLANRRRGVRAIEAVSVGSLGAHIAAVGANLLVLNPMGRGLMEMRRMVELFCRPDGHQCPPALERHLG